MLYCPSLNPRRMSWYHRGRDRGADAEGAWAICSNLTVSDTRRRVLVMYSLLINDCASARSAILATAAATEAAAGRPTRSPTR